MKNFKLILSCLLSLVFSSIIAQEKTVAFFIPNEKKESDYVRKINKAISKALSGYDRVNYLRYKYDKNKDLLTFIPPKNKEKKESKVDYLVFIKNTVEITKPSLKINTDSLQNIINASLRLKYIGEVNCKIVDLNTSEIISIPTRPSSKVGANVRLSSIQVKDIKKYFGKNIKNLKKKQREAKTQKIRNAYKDKINARYNKANKNTIEEAVRFSKIINRYLDNKVYQVTGPEPNTVGKKLKKFTIAIDDNSINDINIEDEFKAYQIIEAGDYKFTKFVGYCIAQKKEENVITMNTLPFFKGKLAKAFKSGNKIVIARNDKAVEHLNTIKKINYRVALQKNCAMCNIKLEKQLMEVQNISLIERTATPIIQKFIERNKEEGFIDSDNENINEQQGVQLILKYGSKGYTFTDVETGKIIKLEKSTFGSKISATLLGFSNEEMELIEVTKKKGKKITRILAYHPFGFNEQSKFKIAKVVSENINGESMERFDKIAKAKCMDEEDPLFCELFVTKGKKELFNAIQKGETIAISPWIYD